MGGGGGVAVASDFPSVVLLLRSGQAVLLKIIQTIHLIGYAVLSVVVKAVSYYFWGSTKIIRERERTGAYPTGLRTNLLNVFSVFTVFLQRRTVIFHILTRIICRCY